MERKKPAQIHAQDPPPGFQLLHTLRGHSDYISGIAWSPDGRTLASGSDDRTIRLWDGQSGQARLTLEGHQDAVTAVAWSPDGQVLASSSVDGAIRLWDGQSGQARLTLEGHPAPVTAVAWSPDGQVLASSSVDGAIRLWDGQSGQVRLTLEGHQASVYAVAWSPDGRVLASGSNDKTVRLWDGQSGQALLTLEGHRRSVYAVAWSPDGRVLASGSDDKTVRLWDGQSGQTLLTLEGHTWTITEIHFSPDGHLLASKSLDNTIQLWRRDGWELIAVFKERTSGFVFLGGLAFHPNLPILATRGEKDKVIRIWRLDYEVLLGALGQSDTRHYRNAKVVLVGDSGVGKSGLGLVLTGQPFQPTESTHGRHVWVCDSREEALTDGRQEVRETLLWDLAGQPGYRLIHQLHLSEVAVALVVFDARSETDPLAGVRHWDRALRQARQVSGSAAVPLKKYLVAARADRGGISVSRERIEAMLREMGFAGYFETSAKEGWKIQDLIAAIRDGIDWDKLPKVSSNELFQTIKQFLLDEKKSGRLLSTADELYERFCQTHAELTADRDLRAEFDTCVGRVESRDLIRRLSFGGYVLLQPELLDAYASAMVNAAKSEPDGLGFIAEEVALAGQFLMPKDERVADKEQEKLLLIATVEELLRYEITLGENAEDGKYLVFPSQFNRDWPDAPDPQGKAVVFTFEGPVLSVYATLAVRLAHSGRFETGRMEMWRNAAKYAAVGVGGTCGIYLREINEGQGELALFFDEAAGEETRSQFEEFIAAHLQRRALPQTVQRRRIFVCHECGTAISDEQAQRRRARGKTTIDCPVCDTAVSLLDREERPAVIAESAAAVVAEMDRHADAQRDKAAAATSLKGKIESKDYDVFLSYNSKDREKVMRIGERLKEQGILPWLDEWEIRPGEQWPKVLQDNIKRIKSAAVFIGPKGVGPWEDLEQMAFLQEFVDRKKRKQECLLIPVVLPGRKNPPKLPPFLRLFHCVDFRKSEPDPLEQLIWGITGKRGPAFGAVRGA